MGGCKYLYIYFYYTDLNFIHLIYFEIQIGIWIEISNPTDDIMLSKDEMDGDGSSDGAVGFEENEISRMKGAAIATAVEHILLPIVKFAIQFATTYKLTEKLGE